MEGNSGWMSYELQAINICFYIYYFVKTGYIEEPQGLLPDNGTSIIVVNLSIFSFNVPLYYLRKIFKTPEPAVRSAVSGVSPGRGLLILKCESHPPLCVDVGFVWFGRLTV